MPAVDHIIWGAASSLSWTFGDIPDIYFTSPHWMEPQSIYAKSTILPGKKINIYWDRKITCRMSLCSHIILIFQPSSLMFVCVYVSIISGVFVSRPSVFLIGVIVVCVVWSGSCQQLPLIYLIHWINTLKQHPAATFDVQRLISRSLGICASAVGETPRLTSAGSQKRIF